MYGNTVKEAFYPFLIQMRIRIYFMFSFLIGSSSSTEILHMLTVQQSHIILLMHVQFSYTHNYTHSLWQQFLIGTAPAWQMQKVLFISGFTPSDTDDQILRDLHKLYTF